MLNGPYRWFFASVVCFLSCWIGLAFPVGEALARGGLSSHSQQRAMTISLMPHGNDAIPQGGMPSNKDAAASHTPEASGEEVGNETGAVQYETMVVAKKNKLMLALYNTLSVPVDEESLTALAQHCYTEVGGKDYEKVLINWYLPGQPKGEKPWAVSNFSKELAVVEILDEDMAKKFPSAKRWQQPGHQPLVP